ncbi:MAG: 16S rRNA (cytosine(1402)-N(4))-methyltransferase [Planctomycetaceae bacterium]|nr:16S rRNA (cytosine(1402)-N(4))-methyltransferase [Planctomycetaceae bacterium]|tara:strand:- start:490 stop:1380 length:891 start_codon:yes stop_codon:yes gene_type:complete
MTENQHLESLHIPVLTDEVLEGLQLKSGDTVIDGTLGGGGHTRAIAKLIGGNGLVISLDRDSHAIERAETLLKGLPVVLAHSNFTDAPEVMEQIGISKANGIILDLGLSSDQLGDHERGFSFMSDGPLDLRFDKQNGEPAYRLVQRLKQDHLANLIYEYGEERLSRRIARKLISMRNKRKVFSAKQIADAVYGCYPNPRKQKIHPATRTFQALRIAVNDELKSLEIALKRLPEFLVPNGRLAIISFHSLEDRRVKNAFSRDIRLEPINRKPIVASDVELDDNPRSRSAKLRIARRI